MNNPFWISKPSILFEDIILTTNNEMNINERLNVYTRLFILLFVIFLLLKLSETVLIIPIIGIIMIILYYYQLDNNNNNYDYNENYKSTCRKPSIKNPMMNNLQSDYNNSFDFDDLNNIHLDNYSNKKHIENIQKEDNFHKKYNPVPCNTDDEVIKDNMNFKFNEDMYRDIEEVYDKKNSQRQFFTMPHYIPNDQEGFGKWLYDFPPTCKEDQTQCLRYQNYRLKY